MTADASGVSPEPEHHPPFTNQQWIDYLESDNRSLRRRLAEANTQRQKLESELSVLSMHVRLLGVDLNAFPLFRRIANQRTQLRLTEKTIKQMYTALYERTEQAVPTHEFRFTNEEWSAYQDLPEQGYSHRHHLEHVINSRIKSWHT